MSKSVKSQRPARPPELLLSQVRRPAPRPPLPVRPQHEASVPRQGRRSLPQLAAQILPLAKPLLLGGILVAGAVLMLTENLLNPGSLLSARDPDAQCQGKVQSQSMLSDRQWGQLLIMKVREPKAKVRQIVKAPYCTLPSLEVRAGVKADREAYALASEPQNRLIILYEGDEYAGYALDVRR